jgi:hypothetical protein
VLGLNVPGGQGVHLPLAGLTSKPAAHMQSLGDLLPWICPVLVPGGQETHPAPPSTL